MKPYIYTLLALCLLPLSLSAKPARRDAITLTQPDGTQITAYLHGDAFFHYYTDAEGAMLERNNSGFYNPAPMPSADELQELRMNNPRYAHRQKMLGTEINLAPRGLVILVSFANKEFTTPVAEMDSMLNGQNYTRQYTGYNAQGRRTIIKSEGSAKQYFHDSSFGQYNPIFDVVGPVTLSKNYQYYGKNDSQDSDSNVDMMIKEACEAVDDQVDFTLYDNNNDGRVDFVYVFYAGYGESDGAGSDYIWPHNYALSYTGVSCVVDGLVVDNYACSNELDYSSRQHDGIGSFCHEFSHVLGLPDLYTTNQAGHKTMGSWDILDYGPYNNDGNTPPAYSSYERFFMGWLTPTLINTACDVELPDLNEANCAVLLTTTGVHNMSGLNPSPTSFYMLENRQKQGWDQYLPGHGLLVTRIRYDANKWMYNSVNNSERVMGVDLIEADGSAPDNNYSGYLGKTTDAYPSGSDSFTDLSDYPVTNIFEQNMLIYFQVKGGGKTIRLDVEPVFRQTDACMQKVIRDGRVLLLHNGVYYDMLGNKQK